MFGFWETCFEFQSGLSIIVLKFFLFCVCLFITDLQSVNHFFPIHISLSISQICPKKKERKKNSTEKKLPSLLSIWLLKNQFFLFLMSFPDLGTSSYSYTALLVCYIQCVRFRTLIFNSLLFFANLIRCAKQSYDWSYQLSPCLYKCNTLGAHFNLLTSKSWA